MEEQEFKHERARLEDIVPRSAPFIIYLDPCGACNFKCSFCPCNISDFQVIERHKMLEWALFEKIVEDLKAFHGGVKVINLFGFGEPLLNPRIADMVQMLKTNGCCREVRITTNASLLTEEKSHALIDAGVDIVRVSVEALSTEGYQKLCGIPIDFCQILKNVSAFYKFSRETGSKITAKIVSETLKTLEDEQRFYDLFSPITDYHFIEELEPYWAEFENAKMSSEPHIAGKQKCYMHRERQAICASPFTEMCIHSNGIVGACSADWKFATQYGNCKAEHLFDIWNGKRHILFQRMHLEGRLEKEFPFCNACMLKSEDKIEDPAQLLDRLVERDELNAK